MNSVDIIEVFSKLSEDLKKMKLNGITTVELKVNESDFKKIDEDFYYRQNPKGNDYVPSDDMILLTIDDVCVKIIKNGLSNSSIEEQ